MLQYYEIPFMFICSFDRNFPQYTGGVLHFWSPTDYWPATSAKLLTTSEHTMTTSGWCTEHLRSLTDHFQSLTNHFWSYWALTSWLLPVTYWSLPVIYRPLSYHQLRARHWRLPVVHWQIPDILCLLPVLHWPLPFTHRPLTVSNITSICKNWPMKITSFINAYGKVMAILATPFFGNWWPLFTAKHQNLFSVFFVCVEFAGPSSHTISDMILTLMDTCMGKMAQLLT